MNKLTKQEVTTIKARIATLNATRAELVQSSLTAQEAIKGCEHGQASQRDIDTAEHAQYVLELWEGEHAVELKQLKASINHLPKDYFKLQSSM